MPEDAPLKHAALQSGQSNDGRGATLESGVPGRCPLGWRSRGYIPHFESSEHIQHITIHLADSLPKEVVERLDRELKSLPDSRRRVERRKRIEAWMDAGHGCCVLREPLIGELVQSSLLSFDAERYRMLAWAIMLNHVHVLFEPINPWTMTEIVTSWKKFTARRIADYWRRGAAAGNATLSSGKAGKTTQERDITVWHREYWDRYIRNELHLHQAIEYIHQNPVKAGLVSAPELWRWSSAFPGNATLLSGTSEIV